MQLSGLSGEPSIKLSRRHWLIAAASLPAALRSSSAFAGAVIRPEHFGARGDGIANDTAAFAAMSAFVNAHGGGTVELRPVTYLVGAHVTDRRPGAPFEPRSIMAFAACSKPLIIRGNGARLRCASGLRYGTFDLPTGTASRHPQPYFETGELATPYSAMIHVEHCTGPVEISDLELDGNLPNLRIGGKFGDTGWQIGASGIELRDNSGPERLNRIRSHHHALDGLIIDGVDRPRGVRSRIEDVRLDHNGRQGCSVVGGRGYDFRTCRFTDTGKSTISSAPGAGVDIESEANKSVRDLTFGDCLFSNNSGVGLLADSGPSDGASFEGCTFIGTTSWAAWPSKPNFRFNRCSFIGAIVHAFGDTDPSRACRFTSCTFSDDPSRSPTGQVYGGSNPSRPIADLSSSRNVLFDKCNFDLRYRAVLPWTTNVVIFKDCILRQRAPTASYPRGTFVGRNVIEGNAVLYSAKVRGALTLNGKIVPPNN